MNSIPNKPGLETMFFPFDINSFKKDYWPNRPAVAEKIENRFEFLLKETPLPDIYRDIRTLSTLQNAPQKVEIFTSTKDTCALTVTPKTAYELFERKLVTIRLRAVHTWIPQVYNWLFNIATDLKSTPINKVYANIYISPEGFVGTPHFDGHEVFFAQLFGKKRWSYFPCKAILYPSLGYEIGSASSSIPLKFGITNDELPNQMPSNSKKTLLSSDCALFLPRGYFHQAHTEEKSLHITFAIETTNWIDIFLKQIKDRLLYEEKWRELPVDILSELPQSETAKQNFLERLENIKNTIADFQDSEIFSKVIETENENSSKITSSSKRT